MAEPSIKGSVFRGVVEDLRRLRDEGGVSQAELERELAPEDRQLLEGRVLDASWYPIACYVRMTDLLCAKAGGGVDTYVARGEASARRLLEAGLYSQLEFLKRWREEERAGPEGAPQAMRSLFTSKLKLVVSMAGAIYNVGRWSVEPEPDDAMRVRIVIDEAGDYSEGMRYAIQGFLDACTRAVRPDLDGLFRTERPAPDRIVIAMTLGIEALYAPRAA